MKNIMVDLETFGTKPYSAIISIGAVYFDPTKAVEDCIKQEFHVTIDPHFATKAGFRVDMETVMWWMAPEQASAWEAWRNTLHFEPAMAFMCFSQWLHGLFNLEEHPDAHDDVEVKDRDTFNPEEHILLWGNGAGFDCNLLREGYELLGEPVPWKHYNERCFRTLKNLTHKALIARDLAPEHEGKHNALLDARQQAKWLTAIAQNFHLKLG